MNAPDPLEGAFTAYGYNWPVPSIDADAARARNSGWNLFSAHSAGVTLDSAGMTPVPLPGALTLTGPVNSAATATNGSTFTVITNGSNVTVPNGWGDSTSIAMTGYGAPPPEPLAVRRFYHWNKSATAGAAGRPGGAQKDDVAGTRPIASVIAANARDTIRLTKSAAVQVVEDEAVQTREHARRRRLVRRTVLSPRSLTLVAVVLAGQKRNMVGEEWRGHLLGEHASGLTQREQTRAARGFVLAAVRYRAQDAADLAWRPADAVLGSRTLSNLFVWGPVIVLLFAIVRHDGRFGLVADIQDPAAAGAFLYGVIRTGRWWRGVKPPEPKAKRARD